MKQLTLIILMFSAGVAATILLFGIYTPDGQTKSINNTNQATTSGKLSASSAGGSGLTVQQVAAHSTPGDCYIIVSKKVYNVSSYINQHPGGASNITSRCGQEVTGIFASIHSNFAWDLLSKYFVANLAGAAVASNSPAKNTAGNNSAGANPASTNNTAVSLLTLTAQDVAKHNTPTDCYIIINNQVYNVSSYINKHPGGVGNITSHCGQEVTGLFAAIHTNFAWNLLKDYLIANLTGAVPAPTNSLINPNAPGRERDDD